MGLDRIPNTNSQILISASQKLGIKVELLDEEKIKLRLSKNGKTHIVTSKSFGINPSEAIKLTRNKKKVSALLKRHNTPTPKEIEIHSLSELKTKILPPFPLVLKPSEGQKAHDVYINIKDKNTLIKTVKNILEKYDSLIVQEFIDGKDLRFFVLNEKVIGIAQRHPPTLTGNGKNTIEQLILNHNQCLLDERQKTNRRLQNRLHNWPRITWHIENQELQMSTILPQGKKLEVYPIANFQAGGTVETIPIHNKTTKNTSHSKKANHQINGRVDIVGSNENSLSCKLFNGRNRSSKDD